MDPDKQIKAMLCMGMAALMMAGGRCITAKEGLIIAESLMSEALQRYPGFLENVPLCAD